MKRPGFAVFLVFTCLSVLAGAQERRKVYIDQDCAGPGGTDMQALVAILNAPDTEPILTRLVLELA